jgi:hypothetical protein
VLEPGQGSPCRLDLVLGDDDDARLLEEEAHGVVAAPIRAHDVDPAAAQDRSVDAQTFLPLRVEEGPDVFLHPLIIAAGGTSARRERDAQMRSGGRTAVELSDVRPDVTAAPAGTRSVLALDDHATDPSTSSGPR